MNFDLTKTMEQHGGRCKMGEHDARIVCTDSLVQAYGGLRGKYTLPLTVLVSRGTEQGETISHRYLDGTLADATPLTTLPETRVFYCTVYSDGTIGARHGSVEKCLGTTPNLIAIRGGMIKTTMTGGYLTVLRW